MSKTWQVQVAGVGVDVTVAVGVSVGVGDGVTKAPFATEGKKSLHSGVRVDVGVPIGGVGQSVIVGLGVGVDVAVPVGVGVGVGERDAVPVGVLVTVGGSVWVTGTQMTIKTLSCLDVTLLAGTF